MNYDLLSKATTAIAANPLMALELLADEYDANGAYSTAKKYGVLVNNSAEDFSMELMTMANLHWHHRY